MAYGNGYSNRKNPLAGTYSRNQDGHVKQVYPTDEISHLWFHKTQTSARNAQGNFYFQDGVIYSYGSHFPIARHIKLKGGDAVFLTTRTWSNTTAQHIHSVRQSIAPQTSVFHVDNVLSSPADQIKAMVRRLKETAGDLVSGSKRKPALHRNKRVELYHSVLNQVNEINRLKSWCGHTGRVSVPSLPDGLEQLASEVAAAKSIAQINRDQKRAERTRESNRRYEEMRENARLRLPERIAKWRSGEYVSFQYEDRCDLETMLRIKGEEVETSLGARFPLYHALLALRVYRLVRSKGETFQRNGRTIRLGHYQIDAIDQDGNITAGCHVITAGEVEHFQGLVETMQANLRDLGFSVDQDQDQTTSPETETETAGGDTDV